MKTYSDPVRRLHKKGAATCVVNIVDERGRPKVERRSCYQGWFLRWTERGTRQQGWIFAAENLDDARARKRALEAKEARGESHVEKIPFGQAADEFLSMKRGDLGHGGMAPPANYKGEPTPWLQELHRRLEAFKTKTFPGKAVSAITLRDVERYFEKRPGGPKSKNMDRGILREFFRWARKHRYTDSDPTDGLHNNKKWKEPRRQARSLTRADEVALLKACREKYTVKGIKGPRGIGGRKGVPRHLQAKGLSQETGKKWDQTFTPPAWLAPLVILALRTALRMGNLLRLDWRHVDLKKQSIRIPAEEMKNKTDLEIPLHPEAQVLLAELKAKAVNLRVLEASGSPVPDRVAVGRAFRRAVKRAKLNPPITFHGLRKVAATRMLQGGADLKTVMAIGGWNDPGTLLRLYAAATEDAKRKAIGTL